MRRSVEGSTYPANWREIATAVKEAAGWCCVRCDRPHDPAAGYTLTVHHLDMDPTHSDPQLYWWNLLALCQRCHLKIQNKVRLERPWVFEHTVWFRIYVAGWYAKRYLGEDLTREETEARIDDLLQLERVAVLGAAL